MWSKHFPLLDLSIQRSAIELVPKKLGSFYLRKGFLTCHECQWICGTDGLSIVISVNISFYTLVLVLWTDFASRDIG